MPKVMPNDMPKEDFSKYWEVLYKTLVASEHPERDLKPMVAEMQKQMSTKQMYEVLALLYTHLCASSNDMLANYIRELYGYGMGKKYFVEPKKKVVVAPVQEQKVETDELKDKVNLETIERYCLNQCVNYGEIKPVYDMLLELLYGVTDQRWLDVKKRIHDRMVEIEKKTTILNEGAELVMEKKVEYEVKNVEAGGTGVNINKGGKR